MTRVAESSPYTVFLNLLGFKSRLKTILSVTIPVNHELFILCLKHVRFSIQSTSRMMELPSLGFNSWLQHKSFYFVKCLNCKVLKNFNSRLEGLQVPVPERPGS